MPALPLTREARIYRALWLKALSDEDPVRINFPAVGAALAFRRAMYRFLQPYRKDPEIEPLLAQAGELCSISAPTHADPSLTIGAKLTVELAEMALEQLGLEESDLLTSVEKSMLATSESRANFEAQKELEESRSTPFYDRD